MGFDLGIPTIGCFGWPQSGGRWPLQEPMSPAADAQVKRWVKAMTTGAKPCETCGQPISVTKSKCFKCSTALSIVPVAAASSEAAIQ